MADLDSGTTTDLEDGSPPNGAGRNLRHERFRIGGKLGEGGMGVVYRAVDTRDGREVALKLMKASLAGTARRRFEREFRSISALHHPHCLNVYDFGELDGGPFFTMELFQGRPITSLAGRPVDEVLDPLFQLTLALDYIHHQGMVHRDVKPSNILVRPAARPDGRPGFEAKLMDFGLAKYYGVKSSLSAEGGFVGTVAYCAPEQINNDELDHRADLYCLGLVSYELLSGRYPFPEARLAGMRPLMRAQLSDTPRLPGRGESRGARAHRRCGDALPPQGGPPPAGLGRPAARCDRRASGDRRPDGQLRRRHRPGAADAVSHRLRLPRARARGARRRAAALPEPGGAGGLDDRRGAAGAGRRHGRAGDRQEQRGAGGRADRPRSRLPGA